MFYKNKFIIIIFVILFIPILALFNSHIRNRIQAHIDAYLGRVKYAEIIKVTIPEGSTNEESANTLANKLPNFNKLEFIKLVEDKQGYLFPDTYFFTKNITSKEIITKMTDNFVKKSNNPKKEIIIMASILEKEGKHDDMRIISGILWHRLKVGMALQVDAAPETYQSIGLPSTPISNPGLFAIDASENPEVSPYFYYLHDKYGIVHLAKNFTEHKQNIKKYLK